MKIKISLLFALIFFCFNLYGQFDNCYYIKSKIGREYYLANQIQKADSILTHLLYSYKNLRKEDWFKKALISSRTHQDTSILPFLKKHLDEGGYIKDVINNPIFKNTKYWKTDSINLFKYNDSLNTIINSNKSLMKFKNLLSSCMTLSNHIRDNMENVVYFKSIDSLSYFVIIPFFTNAEFVETSLKTGLNSPNEAINLLGFFIHANYYSEKQSVEVESITKKLVEKGIFRPEDYSYIIGRRNEVLAQRKGIKDTSSLYNMSDEQRLSIGLLPLDFKLEKIQSYSLKCK